MLTKDTIDLVEVVISNISTARESVLDLVEKEQTVMDGINSKARQDKLRVIETKIGTLAFEIESLYT